VILASGPEWAAGHMQERMLTEEAAGLSKPHDGAKLPVAPVGLIFVGTATGRRSSDTAQAVSVNRRAKPRLIGAPSGKVLIRASIR